jgi:glucose/arabinose dehydrogenase
MALGLLALPVAAQSTPLTTTLVANGFSRPLYACAPPGDTDRLFVVEQNSGEVNIILLASGTVLPTSFVDVSSKDQTSGNERGMLGMAFHPNYASNGFFYLNYTSAAGTTIERYTVSGGNPNVANFSTGLVIMTFTQPQTNHNGGMIDFGPDGMLWIGTGDGGNFNDTGSGHAAGGNAQSGTTLLGKMLRIDVDNPGGGNNYGIPADNPFVGNPLVDDEIWALGLRNPFRHSFDSETGDLWIGDVGQNAKEEIDFVSAATMAAVSAGAEGLNFGWRCMEGNNCSGLSGCTCNAPNLTLAIKDYNNPGLGRAVIGGYVYRGDAIPDLDGTYFYGDNSSNRFWSLKESGGAIVPGSDITRTSELAPGGGLNVVSPAGFGQDGSGELYICDLNGGEVFKIIPDGPFRGLGSALAGTLGEPVHFGTGGVAIGVAGALHLRNAAPLSTAGIFLAFAEGSVPFKGGILKAVPFFDLILTSTDAAGEIDISWTNTGGAPAGTELVTQWGIQDAGATAGVSLSNALITTWP